MAKVAAVGCWGSCTDKLPPSRLATANVRSGGAEGHGHGQHADAEVEANEAADELVPGTWEGAARAGQSLRRATPRGEPGRGEALPAGAAWIPVNVAVGKYGNTCKTVQYQVARSGAVWRMTPGAPTATYRNHSVPMPRVCTSEEERACGSSTRARGVCACVTLGK